jgi:hypothetical protein
MLPNSMGVTLEFFLATEMAAGVPVLDSCKHKF